MNKPGIANILMTFCETYYCGMPGCRVCSTYTFIVQSSTRRVKCFSSRVKLLSGSIEFNSYMVNLLSTDLACKKNINTILRLFISPYGWQSRVEIEHYSVAYFD